MRLSSGLLPALLFFVLSQPLLARTAGPLIYSTPLTVFTSLTPIVPGTALTRDSLPPSATAGKKEGSSPANGGKKETYRKNSLKINASSILLNNYSFSYERMLTRKISFVAGYRFMPRIGLGKITLVKKIIDQVADDGDRIKNDMNAISISNNAFTGEFRFYAGRKAGARGFYLSLYGRYSQYTIDYAYTFETNTKTYTIPIRATPKMWGAGLMIGAQWLIAKRVTLDWYIMGGHYGSIKGDASGVTDLSGMSASDRDDLKSDVEDIFKIGDKKYITATVTNQGVQAKIDGPMVGLRGAGINIGIAF